MRQTAVLPESGSDGGVFLVKGSFSFPVSPKCLLRWNCWVQKYACWDNYDSKKTLKVSVVCVVCLCVSPVTDWLTVQGIPCNLLDGLITQAEIFFSFFSIFTLLPAETQLEFWFVSWRWCLLFLSALSPPNSPNKTNTQSHTSVCSLQRSCRPVSHQQRDMAPNRPCRPVTMWHIDLSPVFTVSPEEDGRSLEHHSTSRGNEKVYSCMKCLSAQALCRSYVHPLTVQIWL